MDSAKKEHELLVSVSPHVRDSVTVSGIMWTVSAALLPALGGGVYYFGLRALYVTLACIAASMASEALVNWMTDRKGSLMDGSGFLTGLLLGLNLPPSSPYYIPVIGSFVAIAITKMLFGGLGFNVFNPALVGRAFVLITWPRAMTTWSKASVGLQQVDATTTATPLGMMKEGVEAGGQAIKGIEALVHEFGSKAEAYKALLWGNVGGSLGETSAVLILIGGLFLMAKRYISWHIPVSFIGSVALFAWIFGGIDNETGKLAWFAGDALAHVLSGGLMLGAFFMATDYVTVPSVRKAQLIFGIGCGALTVLIRLKGGFPEGVMFAILLMNCFTPLLDRKYRTSPFGLRKEAVKS